ncbi:MAG: beta-lactamase family protein [Ignavibacteriales bacterium]|nr:beta-lactamase family protein [Ignavibacteriales bacterium]
MFDSSQSQIVYQYAKNFPNNTEIAIGLIIGESVKHIGIQRRNDSLVYVENRNSIFEIGSITKTFTSTMLANLVFNGKTNLMEPIKNILPIQMLQSSLNEKEVTLLHLANHTSGFPKEPDNINFDWTIPGSPYKFYDTALLYDYLSRRMQLLSTPGEKREYSNLGGGLLGHLLTLITKKSYENLLIELICKPLGMQNTFISLNSNRTYQLVSGRDRFGTIVKNWELNVLEGGGGIKSTAEDMVKYIHTHMTDTTFYPMTQQSTCKYTESNCAGLGWTWFESGRYKFVSATGGTGGYSCCVIFEKSTKKAIILLTNVSVFLAAKGDLISNLAIELHSSL